MNSYISLILEAEGAKERLRRLFQSAPEPEKPGCARPCLSEELALIVDRSSDEVMRVKTSYRSQRICSSAVGAQANRADPGGERRDSVRKGVAGSDLDLRRSVHHIAANHLVVGSAQSLLDQI